LAWTRRLGDADVQNVMPSHEARDTVTDPDSVMRAAVALLAVRQRSIAETRKRLLQRGFDATVVDETIARLVELGLLNDAAFAHSWVESRDRARPRGRETLRSELVRQGITEDDARGVLEERQAMRPEADLDAARRLLERRASVLEREPDLQKRRMKAYALLARSGFEPDVCNNLASELTAAGPADQ
jgi:regulatory protein